MSDQTKDPAGLDETLLAAGKGIARWLESAVEAKTGIRPTIWDGKDGLGAVLQEHLEAAGVPNKRLPELVTPRSVLGAVHGHPATSRLKRRGRARRSA